MTSGGQSTRVGTVTDLRVRKERAWDLLLPLNITKTYNTVVEGRIHSDPE